MMIDNLPYRQVGTEDLRPGGLLCIVDHASNFVPEGIELGIDSRLMDQHIALDIGVGGIAERLARRHNIPAHIACVSRLVCDFHRREDEPAALDQTVSYEAIKPSVSW